MAGSILSLISHAYDALAPEYESQLAGNPVAAYMRTRLHDHLAEVFRAGDRVLDLTAGTGVDACFLAARGIEVIAIDVSPGMLAELERAAQHRGLDVKTHLSAAEHIARLELRDLDGAISTFGGLNTVSGLPQLALDLASCLKPHGRVVLHALNDFCFWQTVRGVIHGHLRFAREEHIHLGATVIAHHFHDPLALWRGYFVPHFLLKQVYALSVVAAPPLVQRFPRIARALFMLDRFVGRLFPGSGDFFVLDLERRDV